MSNHVPCLRHAGRPYQCSELSPVGMCQAAQAFQQEAMDDLRSPEALEAKGSLHSQWPLGIRPGDSVPYKRYHLEVKAALPYATSLARVCEAARRRASALGSWHLPACMFASADSGAWHVISCSVLPWHCLQEARHP